VRGVSVIDWRDKGVLFILISRRYMKGYGGYTQERIEDPIMHGQDKTSYS
jgi:hypothetical protein